MATDAPFLRDDESVADAARKLTGHKHTSLPVVDAEGRYAGMLGIHDILGLLVPRMALAGNLVPNLGFIDGDPDRLRAQYGEFATRHVSDAADRNAPTLKPNTPQIEAIRLFCQSHSSLAVVDPGTRKVLGIVSCWDVIKAIGGSA